MKIRIIPGEIKNLYEIFLFSNKLFQLCNKLKVLLEKDLNSNERKQGGEKIIEIKRRI